MVFIDLKNDSEKEILNGLKKQGFEVNEINYNQGDSDGTFRTICLSTFRFIVLESEENHTVIEVLKEWY